MLSTKAFGLTEAGIGVMNELESKLLEGGDIGGALQVLLRGILGVETIAHMEMEGLTSSKWSRFWITFLQLLCPQQQQQYQTKPKTPNPY